MAITFVQEKKKQRYLVLILALVIFLILLIAWWSFSRGGETVHLFVPPSTVTPQKIEIDWQTLNNPQLQELQKFEEIPPPEVEIGRENPFIVY